METLARGMTYVDLDFLGRPRVIATAVIQSARGVVLIDPGPSTCLATLQSAPNAQGIRWGDVTMILLTHIHLDHAGACGSIVNKNPAVTVYVHERGAPHMVDPSKLLVSAGRLYGDDMERLWGEFVPVPAENVHRLSGGEHLAVADRELEVAYTPGHASHHVAYFDRSSGVAFVGDTAGVRTGPELFVLPPTPPPDIRIEEWSDSISLIRNWRASTLFATHFGPHGDVDAHLDALVEHLSALSEMGRRSLERGDLRDDDARQNAFVEEIRLYLQRHVPPAEVAHYDSAAPLSQCWLGLARYWRKKGVGV